MANISFTILVLLALLNMSSVSAFERLPAPRDLYKDSAQYVRVVNEALVQGKKQSDYAIKMMGYSVASLDQLAKSSYYEDLVLWVQIDLLSKCFSRMNSEVFSAFKELESKRRSKATLSFRQAVNLIRRARQISFEHRKAEILRTRYQMPGMSESQDAADRKFVRQSSLSQWANSGFESVRFSRGLSLIYIARSTLPYSSDVLASLEAAAKKYSNPLFADLRSAVNRKQLGLKFLARPSRIVRFYEKAFVSGEFGYLNPRHIKTPSAAPCASMLADVVY